MHYMKKISQTEHSPKGAAVTELILTVLLANGRLLRSGDILLRDLGLTSARWQVLGSIAESPKTIAQIARDFELTRQGVLWVVQSMVKDDLLERITNPDHKRAKLIRHTNKGKEIYQEVIQRQREWSNNIALYFNKEELDISIDCIKRLGEKSKVAALHE